MKAINPEQQTVQVSDAVVKQPDRLKVDRRTRWAPVLLTAMLLVIYFVVTRPGPALEGWGTDLRSAIAEATSTDQRVLAAFHTDGCPPCAVMERTVLNTARVQKALSGYIPVRVDPFSDLESAGALSIHATPTYAILDAHGKLVARTQGFQSVDEFVKFLNRD